MTHVDVGSKRVHLSEATDVRVRRGQVIANPNLRSAPHWMFEGPGMAPEMADTLSVDVLIRDEWVFVHREQLPRHVAWSQAADDLEAEWRGKLARAAKSAADASFSAASAESRSRTTSSAGRTVSEQKAVRWAEGELEGAAASTKGKPKSVPVEEIARQRERGWPDFHPEDYCHRCGGRNVASWFVDSDRFNAAMGAPEDHQWNGIICPGCFVELHEQATGLMATWKLAPDTPFRPVE